jgi:hypothetical protein
MRSLMVFFLSPFLSFPFFVNDVVNGHYKAIRIISLLIGFIAMLYIPTLNNDKSFYYYYYSVFGDLSITEFWEYISIYKTDYAFYVFIYAFAQFGIPLKFLFLIFAYLTVSIWFGIITSLIKTKAGFYGSISFWVFLILFSFSPTGLFSGVRFYLAISLVLLAIVRFSLSGKRFWQSLAIVFFGSIIHFSCLLFIPYLFLLKYIGGNVKALKVVFYLSFIFLLLPRDVLSKIIVVGGSSDVYNAKVDSYLSAEDYIENSKEIGNFNNYLKYFFKSLWIYLCIYYVMITRRQHSLLFSALMLSVVFSNLFINSPTVYNRYLILVLGLFISQLFYDYCNGRRNQFIRNSLLILLMVNLFGNVFTLRQRFSESLLSWNALFLPTIVLGDDFEYNDIRD